MKKTLHPRTITAEQCQMAHIKYATLRKMQFGVFFNTISQGSIPQDKKFYFGTFFHTFRNFSQTVFGNMSCLKCKRTFGFIFIFILFHRVLVVF